MPPRIRIHADHVRAIAVGHPWVYRQAVAERPRNLVPGSAVDVWSQERPFLARGVFDGDGPIAVRVWTRDDRERFDAALLRRRISEAAALRRAAGVPDRTDAYRIVNGEGDRMPGVLVERWGPWVSVTLQGPGARGIERLVVAAASAALPTADGPVRGIYVRDDDDARLVAGERAPEEFEVREPTGVFGVRLNEPGKPGLFTDMREIRVLFAPLLRGRSFLNLFAHTGAFSAAAAAAGAREVVSVDLSKTFLEWAQRNVTRSAPGYAAHTGVAEDVFEALRRFAREGRRFDAILVDPPTFSSSRRSGAFNVKDTYRPLVRAALRVLSPGGLLLAATNFRGLDREEFLRMLHDAAEAESADLRVLAALGQGPDHPSLGLVPETRHLEAALCALPPVADVADASPAPGDAGPVPPPADARPERKKRPRNTKGDVS